MAKHVLDEISDFEDVSGVTRASPNARCAFFMNCYMVLIALGIIPTCLCKLTFVVYFSLL